MPPAKNIIITIIIILILIIITQILVSWTSNEIKVDFLYTLQ